jgi:hypothetical protein
VSEIGALGLAEAGAEAMVPPRQLGELARYGMTADAAPAVTPAAVGVERTSLRPCQTELASWIVASRETVERILRDWRSRGIVETGYRYITVVQVPDLMRVAGMRRFARPVKKAAMVRARMPYSHGADGVSSPAAQAVAFSRMRL